MKRTKDERVMLLLLNFELEVLVEVKTASLWVDSYKTCPDSSQESVQGEKLLGVYCRQFREKSFIEDAYQSTTYKSAGRCVGQFGAYQACTTSVHIPGKSRENLGDRSHGGETVRGRDCESIYM